MKSLTLADTNQLYFSYNEYYEIDNELILDLLYDTVKPLNLRIILNDIVYVVCSTNIDTLYIYNDLIEFELNAGYTLEAIALEIIKYLESEGIKNVKSNWNIIINCYRYVLNDNGK